ncbi:MAG: hypothetical protein PQJ59_18015, partial [Spirochaetales bacterium]|nr:hypothetical protein [Spirochaetales bacterium]
MNKINYYLRKNPLTTLEENKFMANISQKDTQWQEGVIEHMMKRNNTSIEKTEARIKEADISRLYDYETRSFGLAFTAGGLMGLHGKNLI